MSAIITVRNATHEDAASIAQVLVTVQKLHADAHPSFFRQPESPIPFLGEIERLMNEPSHFFLVAKEAGGIVGYLMAEILRRPETIYHYERKTLHVHQLAVHPNHQKNGHGAALIAAAKTVAKREGLARMGLETWEFNTKAQKFFRKQGFDTFQQRMWMEV